MNQNVNVPEPVKDLSARISQFKARGAHHYDPVRFRFIEAMHLRALAKDKAVKQLLDKKIRQSLSRYEHSIKAAAFDAQRIVEWIEVEFPNALKEAKSYQKSYRFKALTKLEYRLRSTSGTSTSLAALTKQLNDYSVMDSGDQRESNLDSLLYDNLPEAGATTSSRTPHPELKSLKQYREQLANVFSETMVRQIAQQSPENAGPLNPQHLVVRTLMTMKALSPGYINRLVSYYDSLLWLDQTGSG